MQKRERFSLNCDVLYKIVLKYRKLSMMCIRVVLIIILSLLLSIGYCRTEGQEGFYRFLHALSAFDTFTGYLFICRVELFEKREGKSVQTLMITVIIKSFAVVSASEWE